MYSPVASPVSASSIRNPLGSVLELPRLIGERPSVFQRRAFQDVVGQADDVAPAGGLLADAPDFTPDVVGRALQQHVQRDVALRGDGRVEPLASPPKARQIAHRGLRHRLKHVRLQLVVEPKLHERADLAATVPQDEPAIGAPLPEDLAGVVANPRAEEVGRDPFGAVDAVEEEIVAGLGERVGLLVDEFARDLVKFVEGLGPVGRLRGRNSTPARILGSQPQTLAMAICWLTACHLWPGGKGSGSS